MYRMIIFPAAGKRNLQLESVHAINIIYRMVTKMQVELVVIQLDLEAPFYVLSKLWNVI